MGTPSRIRRLTATVENAEEHLPPDEVVPQVYQRFFKKTPHPMELPLRAAMLRALYGKFGHEDPIAVVNIHIAANLGVLLCRLLDGGQWDEAERASIHWRRAVAALERKPPPEPKEPEEGLSMCEWASKVLEKTEPGKELGHDERGRCETGVYL